MSIETISDIDDDEKLKRRTALYDLMAQALAAPTPTVSDEQQAVIDKVTRVATPAIGQTERPGFYDGKRTVSREPLMTGAVRPPPTISPLSMETDVAKVGRASGLVTENSGAVADIPAAPIDAEASARLTNEAVEYLQSVKERVEAGDFSVDQIADALELAPEAIAEHALDEAAQKLQRKEPHILHNYPDVAREMLNLGLKMEAFKTKELEDYKKRGEEYRMSIQKLLKFNALLEKLPSDKTSHDLKEALIKPLSDPKQAQGPDSLSKEDIEQCIKEIFPGGSYVITKDQLSGGKVRTNDIMGEYRTRLTNLLTTEISVVIHNLQMIAQSMQEFCKKRHQLVTSIISHFGGR